MVRLRDDAPSPTLGDGGASNRRPQSPGRVLSRLQPRTTFFLLCQARLVKKVEGEHVGEDGMRKSVDVTLRWRAVGVIRGGKRGGKGKEETNVVGCAVRKLSKERRRCVRTGDEVREKNVAEAVGWELSASGPAQRKGRRREKHTKSPVHRSTPPQSTPPLTRI